MRKFLASLLLMVFMLPFAMQADEITIGTGTSTSYYGPFNNFYKNSWNEVIYPGSSINTACVINSIAYDCATSAAFTCNTLKIYMGVTERTIHETTSDWTPESDLTLVYSGTNVALGASTGWQSFTLDNPFTYEGMDNLVIVVSKTTTTYSSSLKYYYTSTTNACMYRQSDSDASYANYPTATGTRAAYSANVKLNVTPITISCYKPMAIAAGTATPTTASISWTPYTGTSAWDVYITSDGVAPSATTTPTASNVTATSYTFTGLAGGTVYDAYVRTNCGGGDVSSWRGTTMVTEPDFSGNGTEANPYLLYSKADIEALNNVVGMGWSTEGKYFKVMRNISGITEPIANSTYPFKGDFDGNGYTIDVNISGAGYVALFAAIGPGANIHDLTVDGTVSSSSSYAAGIVAYAYTYGNTVDTAPMYVTNCVNKANVICASSYAGGIVAYYYGANLATGSHLFVTNCTNRGDIIGAGSYHGGVVGYNTYYGTVDNCVNRGSVNGSTYSGGVVGRNYAYSTVTNCLNRGDLTFTGSYCGGVTGYNYGANIFNCYNIGSITGASYCGGISGYNYCYNYTGYGIIENVYFAGSMTASNTTYCGAIVGYNYGYATSNYYGIVDNGFYKSGSYEVAYGSSGNATMITNVKEFTQSEDDPTICTLASAVGGTTDLRIALNNWRNGNTDYNEWLTDTYGNNFYFPTFVVGNPPGLEITPDPLAMGPRPIGAWMHGETLTLSNTGQVPIVISVADIANTDFFILDEYSENPEFPITIEEESSVDVYITTNPESTVSAGNVTGSFVAMWGNRTAATSTITATAYEPIVPDVVETPAVVSAYPYTTTQSTATIYDNYYLPGENVDGPDGVYKLTFTTDKLLNAAITEGNNPKLALYKADFGGEPGPGIENYYTGPEIGAGGGGGAFLFNQAEMVTNPGQGAGGADVSAICVGGVNYGPNANWALGNGTYYLLADDFTCESSVSITDMEFYAYQTSSGNTSTMTGLYLQIFDGNPMEGGQVVWGDNATNCMSSTEWTGIYRTTATDLSSTARPIMRVKATGLNISLEAGVYWITVGFTGSLASGPWGAPRAILNQSTTGNGLQKLDTGWSLWLDGGQQGLPMILSSGARGEFVLSANAQAPNMGEGSAEIADAMTPEQIAAMPQNRDDYPVSFGGDQAITNLTVTPGTYYLVASSTSAQYILNIDAQTIPTPLQPTLIAPTDGQHDVTSPVTLKWNLGQFTTEYQLLIGTAYPPTEVVQDWTSELADSYMISGLLNNSNYFWRINERNSTGTTNGTVWGFTTSLNIPQDLYAVDTRLYEGENAVLNWTGINDRSYRGYNVYQDGVKINNSVVTETTYTVEGLAYNMRGYIFSVTAVYDEGESAFSNTATVQVSGNGNVTGIVYEQDGTTPVQGATVTISGIDEYEVAQTFTGTTNADGTYDIDVLAGVYGATADKEGYQADVYVDAEGALEFEVVYATETPEINFNLTEDYNPVGEVIAEEVDDNMVKVYWSWDMMSVLIEDFETGGFEANPWDNTISSYPWAITTTNPYEGTYCMKSTCENVDYGSSAIQITVEVPYNGLMSFYQLISSEQNYDKGHFYIDGVEKATASGSSAWAYKEFDVTEGEHTYKWEYTKDVSLGSGSDCYFIDYVTFYQQPEPWPGEGWIFYDDGTNVDAVGLTAGGSFYWGIMFPTATLQQYGNFSLTKVGYFDYTAHTGTILIYEGGDAAPGTLIHSQPYTAGGTSAYIEFDLTSALPINNTQNLWIVMNNNDGQYVASACGDTGDPNGRWISLDGAQWDDVVALGLSYTWNLRGFITNARGNVMALANDNNVSALEYEGHSTPGGILTTDPNAKTTATNFGMNRGYDRSFNSYKLYRTNCYNEDYTVENTEVLASHITDTVYMDMSWGTAEAGVYKWGVAAYYAGNRGSRNATISESAEQSPEASVEANVVNRAAWDLVANFTCNGSGEQGIVTDGNFIYTSSWSGNPGYAFGKYTMDGVFVEGFNIAGASGIRDLTYDGTYFYGGAGAATLYQMDLANRTLVSTINCSGKTIRHCSYDPVNDGFWVGNWTDLALVSRTGATIQNGPAPSSAYGSGYFTDANGEAHLYLFCQPASDAKVYDYNITTGNYNNTPIYDFAALPGYSAGISGGAFVGVYNGLNCFFGNCQQAPNIVGIYELSVATPPAPPVTLQDPGESEIVWSNCLDKDMYTTLDVEVMTNSGDAPTGTAVSFLNISEPDLNLVYEVELDETGIYAWNEVRKGTYLYSISLDGYTACAVNDSIEIWDATSVECVLEEVIHSAGNLYVSPTGWAMWDGTGTSGPIPPTPGDNAIIVLEAHDVWGDGTGYNMMLDADATVYPQLPSGNFGGLVPTDVFNEFEYLIPEDANPHVSFNGPCVFDGSVEIAIPAGTYDYAIVNPCPGVVYVVGSGGPDASIADDFVFEAGKRYTFTISRYGSGDGVALTVGDAKSMNAKLQMPKQPVAVNGTIAHNFSNVNKTLACVGNEPSVSVNSSRNTEGFNYYKVKLDGIFAADVTTNYYQHDVTNLVEGEEYTTEVAAVYATGMSAWSEYTWTYVPCENFAGVTGLAGEPENGTAVLNWTMPNGGPTPPPGGGDTFFYDFEDGSLGDWTLIDADGDGKNWLLGSAPGVSGNNGSSYCAYSQSYDSAPLTPDNYLVSKQVTIGAGATFEFYACGQDASYAAEHYGVAISTSGNTNAADFTTIWEETMTAKGQQGGPRGNRVQGTWYHKSIDLSAYAGQQVYIALRHFNVTDMFYLDVDDIELTSAAKATRAILFDQSEMITNAGAGAGGADVSALQGSQSTFGPNVNWTSSYLVADDFTLDAASTINEIEVYAYQTGSGNNSTLTGLYLQIYNGNPMSGGTVVWGDNSTNLLSNTYWTNIYRTTSTEFTNTQRPIMAAMAANLDISLDAGQYWLVYGLTGSASSGPWGMPRVLPGELNTGDALQYTTTWAYLSDSGSGTPYGIAMKISGQGGGPVPPTPVDGILGAMVFRNGELLTPTPIQAATYTDATPDAGVNDYCVRVVYGEEQYGEGWYAMSCPECVEVEFGACAAPEDLFGEYTWNEGGTYGATLIWPYEAPVGPVEEWIYYDDGTNTGTVGAGGSVYWGISFDAADLTAYNGCSLTQVALYDAGAGTYTINIYYGGTSAPSTLVHTQNVTMTGAADWNYVTLTTALPLDVTQPLWITIYNSGVTYPAAGCNYTGDLNGCWVSVDGAQWMDIMSASGGEISYTWMVRGFVTNQAKGGEIVALDAFKGEKSNGEISAIVLDKPVVTNFATVEADIDHFNIYRSTTNGNYAVIGEAPANATTYFDDCTGAPDEYYYQVTAVYTDGCESEPAMAYTNPEDNYVMVDVTSVIENGINNARIYPNPTNDKLNIEAADMTRITVTTVLGQVMYDQAVASDNEILDMNQYGAGIYMVRIVTENGTMVKRITVID